VVTVTGGIARRPRWVAGTGSSTSAELRAEMSTPAISFFSHIIITLKRGVSLSFVT
jgi:hypothetical protein